MAGPTILNIKASTFKLADDEAGLTAGDAYSCQITAATVSAQAKLLTVPATMCSPESQSASASGWNLDVGYLQDWGDTGSLSQYLFDNDGSAKAFEIKPTDPAMPTISGTCWVVSGAYGGDMGANLVATVTMPLTNKPTITPAVALLGAEAQTAETQTQAPASGPLLQPAGVA